MASKTILFSILSICLLLTSAYPASKNGQKLPESDQMQLIDRKGKSLFSNEDFLMVEPLDIIKDEGEPIIQTHTMPVVDHTALKYVPLESIQNRIQPIQSSQFENQVQLLPVQAIQEKPMEILPVQGLSVQTVQENPMEILPVQKIYGKNDNADELMVAANSMVFMPVFSYRKTTGERRRVYSYNPYRRSSKPQTYSASGYYGSYPRFLSPYGNKDYFPTLA